MEPSHAWAHLFGQHVGIAGKLQRVDGGKAGVVAQHLTVQQADL